MIHYLEATRNARLAAVRDALREGALEFLNARDKVIATIALDRDVGPVLSSRLIFTGFPKFAQVLIDGPVVIARLRGQADDNVVALLDCGAPGSGAAVEVDKINPGKGNVIKVEKLIIKHPQGLRT